MRCRFFPSFFIYALSVKVRIFNIDASHHIQQKIHDLAFIKSHAVSMIFYPIAWVSAQNRSCIWEDKDFPPRQRNSIPSNPGVYAFVVTPDIFDLDSSSGLFYIGKATNLYSRIGSYISEIGADFKSSSRPRIWTMVNQWNGHLKYYYTITETVAEAEILEKELLKAFRPPFNKQYDAETSREMRAFP